jgi:hypothetical protein
MRADPPPRLGDHRRRQVDPDDMPQARSQLPLDPPDAAADVERVALGPRHHRGAGSGGGALFWPVKP